MSEELTDVDRVALPDAKPTETALPAMQTRAIVRIEFKCVFMGIKSIVLSCKSIMYRLLNTKFWTQISSCNVLF